MYTDLLPLIPWTRHQPQPPTVNEVVESEDDSYVEATLVH